ncbi:hypothetical protein [Arachnia propionica]|uniref:Uncharacterized protein n=1 Tax=Arachnia propionica TaxID=1750 RepID=A0A3P1WY57_9ACTN|nr:hypothetical protein [Arachnia propionica]RRD50996.1 hypothetical protein EII35_02810 [Arachnia propionica]
MRARRPWYDKPATHASCAAVGIVALLLLAALAAQHRISWWWLLAPTPVFAIPWAGRLVARRSRRNGS